MLLSHRKDCGVTADNQFVFASRGRHVQILNISKEMTILVKSVCYVSNITVSAIKYHLRIYLT